LDYSLEGLRDLGIKNDAIYLALQNTFSNAPAEAPKGSLAALPKRKNPYTGMWFTRGWAMESGGSGFLSKKRRVSRNLCCSLLIA